MTAATPEALVDGADDMPTDAEIKAMREEAENFRLPAPPPIPVRDPYYLTECEHCGWIGSSEHCGNGGAPDYDDVICPVCCSSMLGDGPNETDTAKHGEAVYQRIVSGEAARDAALAALQRVTAERDEARERVAELEADFRAAVVEVSNQARARGEAEGALRASELAGIVDGWRERAGTAEAALATATADAASLRAEVEAMKEDAARLDFLDGCNARLNASYGTHYGWKLVLNHNVNRLMLGDMKVDLHDSEGGNDKLPSCRLAIDEARKRTALARAATAGEGRSDA